MQSELIRMVSTNVFRPLPPAHHENTGAPPEGNDPEEEEPYLEPWWPHLQLIYELLLRYVVSSEIEPKTAKKFINHTFVSKLLTLFDSEDPREREYLKTVLHRIYGKFIFHRPFIRYSIYNIFYTFLYETERCVGIGELLEILGSVINGFTVPMREEHRLYLVKAILPLHKSKGISIYHQQLSYIVTQFVEKDYKLADTVIRGLLKYWPLRIVRKRFCFWESWKRFWMLQSVVSFSNVLFLCLHRLGNVLIVHTSRFISQTHYVLFLSYVLKKV